MQQEETATEEPPAEVGGGGLGAFIGSQEDRDRGRRPGTGHTPWQNDAFGRTEGSLVFGL